MTLIRRSSPFGELLSLRQAMDRLFEDSYVRPRSATGFEDQTLPLDIYMNEDALVVRAALPGVKPEDVEITVSGDVLTISGEFREDREQKGDQYLFQELRRGRFTRSVSLPGDIDRDAATAEFQDGLLRLTMPKAEETKPRQIRITPTSTTSANAPAGARSVNPERDDRAQAATQAAANGQSRQS